MGARHVGSRCAQEEENRDEDETEQVHQAGKTV